MERRQRARRMREDGERKVTSIIQGRRRMRGPVGGGSGSGPPGNDGILLEDGLEFVLMEDGSFVLLE